VNSKTICLLSTTLTLLAGASGAQAAELPIPCVAGSCGVSVPGFVTSGKATAFATLDTLRVRQESERAILNWKSFNIGPDGRVVFEQPDASSIALNRIFQGSPSRIFGALEANGQIYLINQNGILFGAGARVNTAGLLASTLNMSDDVFSAGILAPELLRDRKAVLEGGHEYVIDDAGQEVLGPDGKPLKVELTVEEGAQIKTRGSGGRVLLASQLVNNGGRIETPDGQVVLAAGEKVYLAASSDPKLRGLLVEVDANQLGTNGKVTNLASGDISTPRGNATLVGLAVNQEGRISATTTVSANGSVRLLARDSVNIDTSEGTIEAQRGGALQLGATSRISVLPELDDTATAVDDQAQLPSSVEMVGRQVVLRGGSEIKAPGGEVLVTALERPDSGIGHGSFDPASRIRVEAGARIDVSGSTATLPASRNLVTVELRANELADSPLQREGPLRGQPVIIDARVGTPLADVSGALATIPKSIAERTSQGGTVAFNSEGDVVVATGAVIDVSGGKVQYEAGVVQTTQLMRADGRLVDISKADPNERYIALINPTSTVRYDRWGVVETVRGVSIGRYEPGYVEGRSAGLLSFAAPNMVLNGTFVGAVTTGPHQRDPSRVPPGGLLRIGGPGFEESPTILDHRAPSVNLVTERPRIVIRDDAALPGPRPLDLPVDFLTEGGFTRAEIFSNGVVTLPESTPLTLLPGSSIRIAAHRIDVRSDITALGGEITFGAEQTVGIGGLNLPRAGIDIRPGVTLDVRGQWANDLPVRNPTSPTVLLPPVFHDGGTISLTVRPADSNLIDSELILGSGSGFLASGGAWRHVDGDLTPGRGGSISLASDTLSSAFEIGDGVRLEAFGVKGADGGSFSLSANRLDVQSGSIWAGAQRIDPLSLKKTVREGALEIGTSLFSGHGFSHITLAATGQVLPRQQASDGDAAGAGPVQPSDPFIVRSGSDIDLRVRSLNLSEASRTRESGGTVADISRVELPLELERAPSELTMRVTAVDPTNGIGSSGRLNIESGAVFRADARSSFTFAGEDGVFFDGQVFAPSGSVTFATPNPATPFERGFLAEQRIELGRSALVDTSGTALIAPNDAGLRLGEVLGGGTIRLLADRGAISVQSGARLNVAGASAALDLRLAEQSRSYTRKTVASGAGAVELRAAESINFQGELNAHAGVGETGQAPGGTLSIALTRSRGFATGPLVGEPFPTGPRVVRVLAEPFASGPALPNGLALFTAQQLQSTGIDSLALESDGRIELDPGVSLAMGRRLTLDSPAVSLPAGGRVSLQAPYVAFGNTLPIQPDVDTPVGAGELDVRGNLVELVGTTNLQRIAQATFSSSGDLRVRGAGNNGSVGALHTSGDLTLQASRVYPATSTTFTLSAEGGPSNTIRIEQTGTSPGAPLSAAGSLHIVADDIVQGGTLYAPFGTLNLTARNSLTLLDGSLTSVAATDRMIPFGNVQIGSEWVYSDGPTTEQTAIPERRVELNAPEIVTEAQSTVDLRGGGDLYAYEWIPGTGGRHDALAPGENPGLYAILPTIAGEFAPYDPQLFRDSDLQPGDSIYLSGGGGLAAGTYALLPARYALLPGAYLVSAVSGTADLQPTTRLSLADGSPVVAGYRTFAGTGLGETRFTGYSVRPGSYARQLASYQDYTASTFFADRARRLELGRVPLPADAGSLGINTASILDAHGEVLTAAATGGRGASIDVAASRLQLTSSPGEPVAGVVQLDTDILSNWNPARLLLGGRRSADGKSIDVLADSVAFADGANLSLSEIVAVARDEVSIGSNARVASTSASAASPAQIANEPVSVQLTGEGAAGAALLAVSDLSRLTVKRPDGATAEESARISVAAGAELASRGALQVNAPGGAALEGTLSGAGAAWDLVSNRIAFGDEAIPDGITITSPLAHSLQLASSARLASGSTIDFLEGITFGGQQIDKLTLSATSLRNLGAGADVSLAARSIVLEGAAAPAARPEPEGAGALSLNAANIQVGPGTTLVAGFAATALNSTGDIRGDGASALRVAGSLDLTAARVTTTTGAQTEFVSDGAVRILQASAPATSPPPLQLGGSLSIEGESIEHRGTIVTPSGLVSLRAGSDLAVRDGAIVDVAGRPVFAAGREVGSPGGTISLTAGAGFAADAGSLFTLSGFGGEEAGRMFVQAGGVASFGATFRGRSTNVADGGSFTLDAGSLADFAVLNSQLEAGGFTRHRGIRVGSGDLVLAAGNTITARSVKLVADEGRVRIGGAITAQSDNERSRIDLFGSQGVTLDAGAALRAEGLGSGGRGGLITLGTTTGGSLDLLRGSLISTSGRTDNGRVTLRAPAIGGNDVAIDQVASTFRGVGDLVVESVLGFDAPATLTQAVFDGYRAQANTFATAANPGLASRFGSTGADALRLQTGIEVRRTGDIQVDALDLSSWRFGDEPGALTVRATGSINIAGNVSDGFTGSGNQLELTPTRSATLRFTAGARLGSADTGAVVAGGAGDLSIGSAARGAVVRTGTGDIELAAARDIRFLGAGSGAYTAGIPGADTLRPNNRQIMFATQGGQLSLTAGRDIIGRPVTQAVGEWQVRQGRTVEQQTRWGNALSQFGWNTGTLGGGDIAIRAGNDVRDLSVAAADSALELVEGTLTHFRGGVLGIEAGGDISSAYVHATRGVNRLHADGAFTRSRPTNAGAAGSVFSFQDAQIALTARGSVAIETVLHPTMLAQPGSPTQLVSFFTTYTGNSGFSAQSVSGDVEFTTLDTRLESFLGLNVVNAQRTSPWLGILPSNVSLRSLSRDVTLRVEGTNRVTTGIFVAPGDRGQVDLFAARDLVVDARLFEADLAASAMPTPLRPQTLPVDEFTLQLMRSTRRLEDDEPSLVTAGRDILGGSAANGRIELASAARIWAGRDIVDLSIRGQNLRPGDLTSISAGRDLRYSAIARQASIEVGGPGRVDILAGRDVDLGFSRGITTVGRILNPAIPTADGADLTVVAGLAQDMDVARFIEKIVGAREDNRTRLIRYVESETGQSGLSFETATAAFAALDSETQRPFVLETFFRELVDSGREANTQPELGFERGFAAIDALFPNSRPTAEDDPDSPYAGDLRLAFSRIYTLSGGNISLLAPGGLLNVGLANPPESLNLNRPPSELGIVAQGRGDIRVFTHGDVLVNESRLFTLGGGNIAVWSTTGDIDAGRGAKSSVSAPPPRVTVNAQGEVVIDFGGAVAGSGIRTIVTNPNVKPGDVDLIAPSGIVNAGDAGIGAAGNLNVAAQQVVGLDNIQVGGTSMGVPAETSNLGAALSGVSAVASSAANAAESGVAESGRSESVAPLADTALGWLEVFVEGFGEEVCKSNDAVCLERNRRQP